MAVVDDSIDKSYLERFPFQLKGSLYSMEGDRSKSDK